MEDWKNWKYSASKIMKCEECDKEKPMGWAYIKRRIPTGLPILCKACRMKEKYNANKKERKGSFLAALQAKGLNLK